MHPTSDPAARRPSPLGFGSPRLSDYFGMWCILPSAGEVLAGIAARTDLPRHVADQEDAAADAPDVLAAAGRFGDGYGETLTDDGTAVIRLDGTLMKFVSSLSSGTGTVRARQIIRRAKADAGVRQVLVAVDSPGGTVAGTKELADDLAALAAAKPTHVFVEDLMASAALWVGVQGAVVSASETSLVGSIGTYMAVADYSEAAAMDGIKVHVIGSGGHKGAGTPGTQITPEQLAEWQRLVDGLNAHFLAAVGAGRNLPAAKVKDLADGRVHLAADARALGLIDHVESFDSAMSRLKREPKTRRASSSSPPPSAPAGATYQKASPPMSHADPSAEIDSRVAALKAGGMPHTQAVRKVFAEDPALHQQFVAAANAGRPAPGAANPGRADPGGAVAAFDERVAALVAGGMNRAEAVRHIAGREPALHAAYLAAVNAARPARR